MASQAQPPSKFKVALIQMQPKPNDPEFNFAHATSELRRAAAQGAHLAILPEYHLTGFEPASPLFVPCAQTSHKYIGLYQALAAELKLNICAGTIVLTPEPEDPAVTTYAGDDEKATLLNTSYFIDDKGDVLGSYTKTNLWHPERAHLTSSVEHANANSNSMVSGGKEGVKPSTHEEPLPEPHQVFQTPFGPVGILICWDLAFPEAFRSLILAGAKIILVPTCWYEGDMSPEGLAYNKNAEKLFLQSTLVSRAFENTCAVIFCNVGGPENEGLIGISQVALPIIGTVEGSFQGSETGIRVVDVDMEIVEVAERNYKVREDIQKSDWHYGYK